MLTASEIDAIIDQEVENAMVLLKGRLKMWLSTPPAAPPPPAPQMGFALTAEERVEGDSGTTVFQYTVTRSVVTTGSATVDWAVTGTGVNPANAADFGGAFPSGQVAFADGETAKTFDVLVTGDTTIETDETFLVTLSNPSAGVILTATAIGTIVNDDVGGGPQPIALPDGQWAADYFATGPAPGWANGIYPLGNGITLTVSGGTYTATGVPF